MEQRTASATQPPRPLVDVAAPGWMLEEGIDYLNHGCFGARTRSVYDAQCRWRERFESRPVEFLERRLAEWLDEAKAALGGFLGMQPESFGFTTNATESVNAVLRSLRFESGDEIATTSHVYNAVGLTMRHLAERAGANVVEIDLPLPLTGPDDVVEAIERRLTDRTRLLIVDHVTSPTAVCFPVERIVSVCDARGIDVLVDGAHAPGMLALDVEAIGAAYYAGNLHKWVCAPPGAAFLWVRPDRQDAIHPTVISHFLGDGLAVEFGWQGTRDISAWLAVKSAIDQMDDLVGPESWARVRAHNHALATWVQARLAEAWNVPANTPLDGSMLGSMAALPVPESAVRRWPEPAALHRRLYEDARIEIPIFDWCGRWLIRPSCQVYNRPEQYERLAEEMRRLM